VSKSTDITAHVKQNAPMNVGTGGYADACGTDQHNQGERRVNAIRDALVKAGVASDKIQTSASASRSRSATNRLTLAGSAIVASTWDSAPAIK
jgi:Outer membrane protein and related peptidoglycan-associated (lipo)proteins